MDVLICEKDRIILRPLVDALNRNGFLVDTVLDGKHAKIALSQKNYDVVVLDILAPHINGFEFIRSLHHSSQNRLYVVVLTSKLVDHVEREIYALGVDLILAKPFNPVHLSKALTSLIHHQESIAV